MFIRPGLFAAMVFVAACTPAENRDFGADPFAPFGPVDGAQSADGLIVGHRLMAAGEYQLALRAYSRAAARHGLNADTLSAIGSAQMKLGRFRQAETTLRRAVALDGAFPAAWNNLGVVLMETGNTGEAEQVFRRAYALDNGESDSIRDNLRLAIAKNENTGYDAPDNEAFELVRRGSGEYLLFRTPQWSEQ